MKILESLACLLVAISCGGGGDGGGGGGGSGTPPDQITDEDQSVIVAEVLSVVQSAVARAFATPILGTKPATSATTTETLKPMATFACGTASGHGSCSCTLSGVVAQCHVVIDDQELCEVSGSVFTTGTIDAVGTPDTGSVDGEIRVSYGAPSCVVSPNDRLAIDGLLVATVTARSGPGYSHALLRMVSVGITVSRHEKVVGVCMIDITVTESGVSGSMCGKPYPPPMPKSPPT